MQQRVICLWLRLASSARSTSLQELYPAPALFSKPVALSSEARPSGSSWGHQCQRKPARDQTQAAHGRNGAQGLVRVGIEDEGVDAAAEHGHAAHKQARRQRVGAGGQQGEGMDQLVQRVWGREADAQSYVETLAERFLQCVPRDPRKYTV